MADEDNWQIEFKSRLDEGDDLEFDPKQFAKVTGTKWPNDGLNAYFERQVAEGQMRRLDHFVCPSPECGEALDQGMLQIGECGHCGFEFELEGEEPIASVRYLIIGKTSRDIAWMIVVHGFNTRGPWQEDLSWLIANKLRYSAPVLIYKYGWATIDVLSRPLQKRQIKSLGRRIQKAVAYAKARGIDERPDVIAHSFGTHLLTQVLLDPEFKNIRLGRIITVGSIVRPDFKWSALAKSGRIGAVLNHMGGKDGPVQFAQFAIPGTGPGARVGALDPHVTNHYDADFAHSTALGSLRLQSQLGEGGMWDRFLTQPEGRFEADNEHRPAGWKPAWAGFRAITRALGYVLIVLLGMPSYLRRKLDP